MCFSKATWALPGYGSYLNSALGEGNISCTGELLTAFVDHVLHAYGLLDLPPPSAPYFTFISRQDYDGRNISRKLANEAEIVEMLKHGFNVGVQYIDLAALPSFRDQIS